MQGPFDHNPYVFDCRFIRIDFLHRLVPVHTGSVTYIQGREFHRRDNGLVIQSFHGCKHFGQLLRCTCESLEVFVWNRRNYLAESGFELVEVHRLVLPDSLQIRFFQTAEDDSLVDAGWVHEKERSSLRHREGVFRQCSRHDSRQIVDGEADQTGMYVLRSQLFLSRA